MVAVATTILLTIISLPSYFLSNYLADATSSGRVDDGQSSEDLGKEEEDEEDVEEISDEEDEEEDEEDDSGRDDEPSGGDEEEDSGGDEGFFG